MSNFRKARIASGLSQKEIAISLGVSNPTVSNWERGERIPAGKNLKRLAELLSCSTDYLLGKVDTTNQSDLFIPDDLKDVQIAFNRGEFEDLTQDEVDRVAEFAKFIRTQRKQ